ncbi:MAG TPA: MFS transporter [Mucilaginibacter sp.]|jgi:MFS family permease|nr:MFS transporter [Mucilaginibacter sp.]
MTQLHAIKGSRNIVFLVIVASLGYFVDIYDLMIFSIVRIASLHDIGIDNAHIRPAGIFILNMQVFGLMLGGILWGILGDKLGRLRVLFGSILLYSLANIANGMVHDLNSYAIVRFIAGVGLSGELGAGITLVSETLSKEKRGYGTMTVSMIGLLGSIAAGFAGNHDWRTAYYIGGGLGLLLLALRLGTFESGLYKNAAKAGVSKGNILMLFTNRKRFLKYLYCIMMGAPIWFIVGIIITLSPELSVALGAPEKFNAGTAVMTFYCGAAVGNILAAVLAQLTRSRKLTMLIFLLSNAICVLILLNARGITSRQFIAIGFMIGLTGGYLATLVTIATEQFGTNIRATVTTTVPNFIRGTLIPINAFFSVLLTRFDTLKSGMITMIVLTTIALFALSQLKESFSNDLDYLEITEKEQESEPELVV